MFERYTENARRVIFFARYEASQYGSSNIETEHLLLGLMRESRPLMQQLLGPAANASQIRAEIEKFIKKGKRFATSVEVPLSAEAKSVLALAAEEAERLSSWPVGPEHLFLGLLRVNRSRAARILNEMGGKLETIREEVTKLPVPASAELTLRIRQDPVAELQKFLARLGSNDPGKPGISFARSAQMVDFKGTRWRGRDKIHEEFQNLFAAYAKTNVTSHLESVEPGPGHTYMASVLWGNVMAEAETPASLHRMTVIFGLEDEEWVVFFLQVTPVAIARNLDA